MPKKKNRGSDEAAFLSGRVGVDGVATEAGDDDAGESAERSDLFRQRAYLGRELLTWALYRSESGDPLATVDDQPVTMLLVGRTILRGISGDASEIAAKGQMSAYSKVVKNAIHEGLLVHQTRLRFMHGEQVFEATLEAERFSIRSADLPELLAEEEDERLNERLWLAEKLTRLFDAVWDSFISVRTSPEWNRQIVPKILEWLQTDTATT